MLDRLTVVLYEPQNDLNIGAVVRASRNFGVHDVRLVRPANGDPDTIRIMAPNLDHAVGELRRFDTLDDAVSDCHHVVAVSNRPRKAAQIVAEPRGLAASARVWTDRGERVALMFGREDHGLPNEALDRCNAMVTIPTTAYFNSLNLAQAVLLILWEHFRVAEGVQVEGVAEAPVVTEHPVAPREQVERMLEQARAALERVEFFKYGDGTHVMRSLRSVFGRAQLDTRELAIWFGIFKEVVGYLDRHEVGTTRGHQGMEPDPETE
jgi:tRNA/rRNA methyltransferase/tRNA (cytidine32/uridine32-2'-O)-methyltransferase